MIYVVGHNRDNSSWSWLRMGARIQGVCLESSGHGTRVCGRSFGTGSAATSSSTTPACNSLILPLECPHLCRVQNLEFFFHGLSRFPYFLPVASFLPCFSYRESGGLGNSPPKFIDPQTKCKAPPPPKNQNSLQLKSCLLSLVLLI